MINYLRPYIESRLEVANPSFCKRKQDAEMICSYLEKPTEEKRNSYYEACAALLENPDSVRLALYLPFSTLKGASAYFKWIYREAWYRLLFVHDVRENFHFGDCFEVDARPEEGLERVSKAAHLTPWLLKECCVTPYELVNIMQSAKRNNNHVMVRSFKDVIWFCIAQNLIPQKHRQEQLREIVRYLPKRVVQEPLYVSDNRQKWLDEIEQDFVALTPTANLAGPFSVNISAIMPKLKTLADSLAPEEIVLVGGSSLKGYGSTESDLDVYRLDDLLASVDMYPGSAGGAHLYYNCLWLGGSKAKERLWHARIETTARYSIIEEESRKRALERLESDLLQYRLLHKGFARFTKWAGSTLPVEIDGDCPFYDDEYRKIATMLYAKYVWL